MADLGIAFDSSTVKPDEGRDFGLIPTGTKVKAMVMESKVKPTSSGGSMAELTWLIIEGEHEKRRVWQNITLRNNSEKAQQIGQAQLSAVCHAVGHIGPLHDTGDLHDKPAILTLGIEKGTGGYKDKNTVTKVQSVNGAAATIASAPAQMGGSAAPSANPPWKR